jgi:hypothetical protein
MRNTNSSINLWPIQFSDYSADMRKSNAHNGLWKSSILARGDGAMRACLSPGRADERGSQRGDRVRLVGGQDVKVVVGNGPGFRIADAGSAN